MPPSLLLYFPTKSLFFPIFSPFLFCLYLRLFVISLNGIFFNTHSLHQWFSTAEPWCRCASYKNFRCGSNFGTLSLFSNKSQKCLQIFVEQELANIKRLRTTVLDVEEPWTIFSFLVPHSFQVQGHHLEQWCPTTFATIVATKAFTI